MNQENNPLEKPESAQTQEPQNLTNRVVHWAAPPVFPDDNDLTRRAAALNNILIGAIILSFLYGLSLPVTSSAALPVAGMILALIGVFTYGLFNIRRGNVIATGYIVIVFSWLLVASTAALFGGISGPAFSSVLVITIAAGVIIGFQAAIVVAAGSLFYGLVLLYLGNVGVIQPFSGTAISYFAREALNISIIAYLIYLTIQNTSQTLQDVEKSQKDLEIKNEELIEIKTDLENTIEDNLQQIERQTHYLDAAALIAQSTTNVHELQAMVDNIVTEIANQFGYYHVGLFLIDESSQWAILRAASSIGGKAMIDRQHRLAVGKQGIVGFVTGIGQPRITQDILLDRIHSITPELPETRSEMALPLKTRGEIIGALDIQENTPNAFSGEDVSALQILADQIALAIENLQLVQQMQDSLEEVQRVYGDYSQKAWAETHRQKSLSAYKFSEGVLTPIENTNISLEAENKVEIPIIVRGHQIGVIEISRDDPLSEWTTDEEDLLATLSDQLGIALDSARLFNETQLRATTEQIIGNINAEIMESLEINSILRTTVEKIRNTLELPEVSIKMAPTPTAQQHSSNGNPQDADESN